MKKLSITLIACLVFFAFLGLGMRLLNAPKPALETLPIQAVDAPSATPGLPVETSQTTPDGKQNAVLRTQGEKVVIVVEGKEIFTLAQTPGETYSLPFNTWSPNGKYLFIKKSFGGTADYLVITSSGKNITPDSPAVSIGSFFAQSYPGLTIDEVTGWAAPTLLIVNYQDNNAKNHSVWFDISNRRFYKLSTYFN